MTSFENNETTWDRLDYRILQNSPISLYWKVEIWDGHADWFQQNGYRVVRLDAADWTTEKAFHLDIKTQMNFPDYYGMNLNALNDCLGYLEFHGCDGVAIAIKNYHRFQATFPQMAQAALDVLGDNSWTHLLCGNRLVMLVQTDRADASFEPVGAKPVMWNPEEWLGSQRGL